MHVELITREDLQQFKTELLTEFKSIISKTKTSPQSKWLKSAQVRELLKISPGTLLTLRVNGHLRYTKVGGSFYYQYEDIELMLANGPSKKR
jgi:hypothetical protein